MKSPESLQRDIQTGLPLKIAGIVFWGLMAVALIIATVAIKLLEQEIIERYHSRSAEAVSSIQAILAVNPNTTPENLHKPIRAEIDRLQIPAAAVERGFETTTVGIIPEHHIVYSAAMLMPSNEESTDTDIALVSVFELPVSAILKTQKKKLMVALGAIFFVFGLLLQWILQRVLTRPFLQMVNTAERCSHGEEILFDATRPDEFGYLASFINKALDALNDRRRELSTALERAMISEHALFAEKERAEVTLKSIAEGVITIDREGNICFMNPVAETLSGWSQNKAADTHIDEVIHLIDDKTGDHVESLALACLRSNSIERSLHGRLLMREDGTGIAVEESASPMHDCHGNTVGAVLVLDDVRQKKALTAQLSYQATHDPLTGLYNRNEFEKRVRRALEGDRDERDESALCYMDLDQFKIVNDTCGHIAGDELLRQLGQLLQQKIRESDTIARLGGDEFGILFHDCSMDDAERLAAALRKAIHDYDFWWEGKSFNVGASIGLVPLSNKTQSVTEALAAADVACYAAKDQGRGQVHVYEPNDAELKRRRGEMQWVGKIRQALKENRFQLCVQPIVPVGQPDDYHSHAEILLRMLDESGEAIAPGHFLGAAELYGLMPLVDEWVLAHSLEWLGSEAAHTQAGALISINLSGQSLSSRLFLPKVVELLHLKNVSPEQICFEITETAAVANFEVALEFIQLLKGMGCQFAIDDFGNGMSSFSYLKQLPVDYLKIDGSYVRDLLVDPIDRALVEAVNQIGHSMGMKTIAEFVEDRATLAALSIIGVDYAQGYGIGRPQPIGSDTQMAGSGVPFPKPVSRSG